MSAKAKQVESAARLVADYLDGIGEHKRANDVRRICNSASSLRETARRLYQDNLALRERGTQ